MLQDDLNYIMNNVNLTDEHYNWPIKTDNVVEWRYLNEWENET